MSVTQRLADATDGQRALAPHLAAFEAESTKGGEATSASQATLTAALLQAALHDPACLVMGELLRLPQVNALIELSHSQSAPLSSQSSAVKAACQWAKAAEAVAFGNYREYADREATGDLPPLLPAGTRKLRQLTLASLATKAQILPYDTLMMELGIPQNDVRELEDVVIDAVYGGVIAAKLDQSRQCLVVQGAMGRDLRKGDIAVLKEKLAAWSNQSEKLLATLQEQVTHNHERAQAAELQRQAHVERAQEVKSVVRAAESSSNTSGMLLAGMGDFHGIPGGFLNAGGRPSGGNVPRNRRGPGGGGRT